MKILTLVVLSMSSVSAYALECTPCAQEYISPSYQPASFVIFDQQYDNLVEQRYFASFEVCQREREADNRCAKVNENKSEQN